MRPCLLLKLEKRSLKTLRKITEKEGTGVRFYLFIVNIFI